MAEVGFSTGIFYWLNDTIERKINLCYSLSSEAIELSFKSPNELLEFKLTEQTIYNIKKFKQISIHAPWSEIPYCSDKSRMKLIKKLSLLHNKLNVKGIVLHPEVTNNLEKLNETGLPFLLENMDKRKNFGIYPEHFAKLKEKYNFRFVLDLQHIYEHDPTMQMAKEFIEVMGDRLNHFHVSGQTKFETHFPTHLSDNKKAIEKVLELGIDIPKILEGTTIRNLYVVLKNELEYICSYEKFNPQ